MRSSAVEKILAISIKIGIWILPILPLYVSGGMLFPFITGKNFFFRFIVELVFALWVGLALIQPYFRPKLTFIFKSAAIFIVVLFLADLFSPNPYRSFFSNYERMEGFMMLGHLYLYFVVLASVFKTKKDWWTFFHVSLGVSLIVSLIGLAQRFGLQVSLQGGYRVDSTIGNPAYLAAYLSFHVWLLLILLKQFWHNLGLRIFYLAALAFELVIIYLTATRGAILAMLAGAVLLLAVAVFFWNRMFPSFPQYRKWAAAVLGFVIILPISIWLLRDTSFVRSQQILNRMTSISLSDKTTQSRFLIWNMSLKGVMERPVLGWGQENYYLVFQKYYDPGLYGQEPWFDRSHNIFFDWAIHSGILGLISYLGMIAAALWAVLKAVRNSRVHIWEGAILALVFIVHIFEDFFVFDSLNTYLLFFAFLAFTQFRTASADQEKIYTAGQNNGPRALAIATVFLVGVFVASYWLHWKPMVASNTLTKALGANQARRPLPEIQGLFAKALSYESFGNTEIREQLGNMAREVVGNNNRGTDQERADFVRFAIEEMRKETSSSSKDVKHMVFLASILGRAGAIDPSYVPEAEKVLKEAISLSKGKQMLYFELAQVYLGQNRINEAVDTLRAAAFLDISFQDAIANLVIIGLLGDRPDIVAEATPLLKIKGLKEDSLFRLGRVYQQVEDFASAKVIYAELVERKPENPQYHAIAAALFAQFGEFERAIKEAQAAALFGAEYEKEAEIFIQRVKDQMK